MTLESTINDTTIIRNLEKTNISRKLPPIAKLWANLKKKTI